MRVKSVRVLSLSLTIENREQRIRARQESRKAEKWKKNADEYLYVPLFFFSSFLPPMKTERAKDATNHPRLVHRSGENYLPLASLNGSE